MRDVVIAGAVRTPIGALGGSLATIRPDDLAAHVLRVLIENFKLTRRRLKKFIWAVQTRLAKTTAMWLV
jgi:acetyl-CoA acetyltransferase